MPVELSDLLSNKRWVPVEVAGHTIQVAYRPGATSFRRQAELQRQMRQLQSATDMEELEIVKQAAGVFVEVVCDWDLTSGGLTLPITVDTAIDLPSIVFNAIMEAVNADGKSDEGEKKASNATSGAISRQADKLVTAQNGIPSSEPRGTWA